MKNLREILLKKADSDDLNFWIKHIREDILEDMVIESLEKMAAVMSPNSIVTHYANNISKSQDGKAIRDALGHHASHYKAALKSGNEKLADQHMKQIYNIAHVAKSADYISNGEKIKFEHANPHAWEANHTHRDGKEGKTDTVGFKWNRKNPDFSWLRKAPHESRHKTVDSKHHDSAYPLEEMKINDKHIHIEDLPEDSNRGFVPHEYDNHPVFQHNRTRSNKVDPEHNNSYPQAHHDYYSSEHHNAYKKRHSDLKEKDTDAYKARGSKASDPVHDAPVKADAPESKKQSTSSNDRIDTSKLGDPNLQAIIDKYYADKDKGE